MDTQKYFYNRGEGKRHLWQYVHDCGSPRTRRQAVGQEDNQGRQQGQEGRQPNNRYREEEVTNLYSTGELKAGK